MSDPAIRIAGVTHRYPGAERDSLSAVSLSLAPGGILVLRGESGSGKTTLLNLIAALDRPSAGEVHVLGHPIHRLAEADRAAFRAGFVGYVFQHHLLPPGMTAAETVASPMLWTSGLDPAEAMKRAEKVLSGIGLSRDLIRRPVEKLSGGQRQRVAIARALAGGPSILLADEPTAHLDPKTAGELLPILWEWAAEKHRTMVIAAHGELPSLPPAAQTVELSAGKIVA